MRKYRVITRCLVIFLMTALVYYNLYEKKAGQIGAEHEIEGSVVLTFYDSVFGDENKPMLFLATSPGPGGAASVLATATTSAPFFHGKVIVSLSLASFYENFDSEQGRITNHEINRQLLSAVNDLTKSEAELRQNELQQSSLQQADA